MQHICLFFKELILVLILLPVRGKRSYPNPNFKALTRSQLSVQLCDLVHLVHSHILAPAIDIICRLCTEISEGAVALLVPPLNSLVLIKRTFKV